MHIPPEIPKAFPFLSKPREKGERGQDRMGGKGPARLDPSKTPVQDSNRFAEEQVRRLFFSLRLPPPDPVTATLIQRFILRGGEGEVHLRGAWIKRLLEKKIPLSSQTLDALQRLIDPGAEGISKDRMALTTATLGGVEKGKEPPEEAFTPDRLPERETEDPDPEFGPPYKGCGTNGQEGDPCFKSVDDFLDQFNQAKGPEEGRWMFVPFSLSLETQRYDGSLRLYLPSDTVPPSKIVVSLRRRGSNGLPWYFLIYPQGIGGRIRMFPPLSAADSLGGEASSLSPNLLKAFRKKLRKIGFVLDDNNDRDLGFDGFDEAGRNYQNIDKWA